MNEFKIKIVLEGDRVSESILLGRKNNHDCWNLNISDWREISKRDSIEKSKADLKNYLLKEDKGAKTISSILKKIIVSL